MTDQQQSLNPHGIIEGILIAIGALIGAILVYLGLKKLKEK